MTSGRRRDISSFNLAFLDIMFCGFGAVVLLVLIVQANTLRHRKERFEDLQDEVNRAGQILAAEKTHLSRIRTDRDGLQRDLAEAGARLDHVKNQIERLRSARAEEQDRSQHAREDYDRRKDELKQLQAEVDRLKAEEPQETKGSQIRSFAGEGYRQYLTGLKLGGRRIAVLVDVSGSMLDETVVDIMRRRNMSDRIKRNAPKWRQAVKTIQWLVANMPAESKIQIIAFNSRATILGKDNWIAVRDAARVDGMLEKLNATIPAEGTNLNSAFTVLQSLSPRPDNCILLTDGLPTLGPGGNATGKVSSAQRVRLFHKALKSLPASLPVNTILFPMEGDPMAASLFWQMAISTRGSFFTPTRDWP